MRPAYENQQGLKSQLCAYAGRGYRRHQMAALPGMPSAITISRWVRADPGFAAEMAACRMYGTALRRESGGWFAYDHTWAEMFLTRVAQVGMMAALRTPGQPCRNQVDRWKRVRPEFAARLEAVKGRWRIPGRKPRAYDEATADRIILTLNNGVLLRALRKADPSLPGAPTVRRWRHQYRDFNGAVRIAMRCGHFLNVRAAAARWDPSPALTDRIADRILDGATLNQVGMEPGMPRAAMMYAWMQLHPDFARAIWMAREERHIRLTETVIELARACTPETVGQTARAIRAIRRQVDGDGA